MESNSKINSIDEYIISCPIEYQKKLVQIRESIKQAAPQATEAIKYQMPTFVLKKNLVHFALCKNHIGLYPTPLAIIHFSNELSEYICSKGAIQFPHNKDIPIKLIQKIVEFRVKQVG